MKKKLLLAGATLLLVAAAVTGFAAYERSNMSDLMDANVEALARNEDDKTLDRVLMRQVRFIAAEMATLEIVTNQAFRPVN